MSSCTNLCSSHLNKFKVLDFNLDKFFQEAEVAESNYYKVWSLAQNSKIFFVNRKGSVEKNNWTIFCNQLINLFFMWQTDKICDYFKHIIDEIHNFSLD